MSRCSVLRRSAFSLRSVASDAAPTLRCLLERGLPRRALRFDGTAAHRQQLALVLLHAVRHAADAPVIGELDLLAAQVLHLQDGDLVLRPLHRLRQRDLVRRRHLVGGAVAEGAPGVAGDPDEVALLHPFGRHLHVVLRAEGDVLLREVGGLAVRTDVGAQEAEVAGVARPHPVVDLATEVADPFARGVGQADVADLHLGDFEEERALVEARYAAAPSARLLTGVDQQAAAALDLPRVVGVEELHRGAAQDLLRHVADAGGDVDIGAWCRRQLCGELGREEAVGDEIALGRRVELQRTVDAVVVGDDQALRRDERSGAAAERDHCPHRIAGEVGQLRRVERHAGRLELRREVGNLARHPHALVRAQRTSEEPQAGACNRESHCHRTLLGIRFRPGPTFATGAHRAIGGSAGSGTSRLKSRLSEGTAGLSERVGGGHSTGSAC